MIDIKRLAKAWEIFRDSNPYEICDGREFRAIKDPEYCMGQMIEDTIALLKELEAKQVGLYGKEDWLGLVCVCPDCEAEWMGGKSETHFCPNCGRPVKWIDL